MYEVYQHTPSATAQKNARKALKILYEAIPETEGCSENIRKDGGCGAWCCQIQTPQVFFSEFLNTWNAVKNQWPDSKINELFLRSVANYLNSSPTKGCVFWDKETKGCMQHLTRPYNCRTYGQIPGDEFWPRYDKLKVLYPDADIRPQCSLLRTQGKTPSQEDMNQWFRELMVIEYDMGVDRKLIHGEAGGTYRTYHDHILLMFAPASVIMEMNDLRNGGTDEAKAKFMADLRKKFEDGSS